MSHVLHVPLSRSFLADVIYPRAKILGQASLAGTLRGRGHAPPPQRTKCLIDYRLRFMYFNRTWITLKRVLCAPNIILNSRNVTIRTVFMSIFRFWGLPPPRLPLGFSESMCIEKEMFRLRFWTGRRPLCKLYFKSYLDLSATNALQNILLALRTR